MMSSCTYLEKSKTNLLAVFVSAISCYSMNSEVYLRRFEIMWVSTPSTRIPKRTSSSPTFIKYTSSTVLLNFEVNVKSTFRCARPGNLKFSRSRLSSPRKILGWQSVFAIFKVDCPPLNPTYFLGALKLFCFFSTSTINLRFGPVFPRLFLFSRYWIGLNKTNKSYKLFVWCFSLPGGMSSFLCCFGFDPSWFCSMTIIISLICSALMSSVKSSSTE